MKIVLVSEFYYPHPGGVTEHVHHLARYLVSAGHRVRVVTSHVDEAPRRASLERADGFEVVRFGRGVAIDSNGSQSRVTVGLGLDKKMRAALQGADLVHVQSPLFPMLPYLALRAARALGVPTVGTFHTHFDGSRVAQTFRAVLQSYAGALDRCIAVSESAARSVRRYVDVPCVTIPNGVDVAAWAAPATRSGGTIVFLGRLDPRNDVALLLRAFTLVARERPHARLRLVGDGPRRAEYEASIDPALRSRVEFAGAVSSVDERAALLASADVLAFTARIVSHPMALLEGLAAGLPAVAYDIEGVRELVSGREGRTVPLGDTAALAAALGSVLDDSDARAAMGRHARARALGYDWRLIGARIEHEYDAALSLVCARGAA